MEERYVKQSLRKESLHRRNALTSSERMMKSRKIMDALLVNEVYQKSSKLLVYASMRSEVHTEELISIAMKAGKLVYLPKTFDENIKFYQIYSLDECKSGTFGVSEPPEEESRLYHYTPSDSLMIMPGCAYDRDRNRIGYGKGFYDRYLDVYPMNTIALFYDCQDVGQIAADPHDICPDQIITETRSITKYV